MPKTENIPKRIDNEVESVKKGKFEKVDTEGAEQEMNNVHKMDEDKHKTEEDKHNHKVEECNYDEIKVIQENMVTVDEKVETRF